MHVTSYVPCIDAEADGPTGQPPGESDAAKGGVLLKSAFCISDCIMAGPLVAIVTVEFAPA